MAKRTTCKTAMVANMKTIAKNKKFRILSQLYAFKTQHCISYGLNLNGIFIYC